MSSGAMDMEDIVIWGKVRPDMTWNETVRIEELCKWGEKFQLDGFVRYLFGCFPPLNAVAHGALLQDGNGLVSITLLIHRPGWPMYDPIQ